MCGLREGDFGDRGHDHAPQPLTKGQMRKLNALRKSIGDDLAGEVFGKWLQRQASGKLKEQQDPIADRIAEALAELATDPTFNLGNYGYTAVRARGKVGVGAQRLQEHKAHIRHRRAQS